MQFGGAENLKFNRFLYNLPRNEGSLRYLAAHQGAKDLRRCRS